MQPEQTRQQVKTIMDQLGLKHRSQYGRVEMTEAEFNFVVDLCRFIRDRRAVLTDIEYLHNWKGNSQLSLDMVLEANRMVVKEFDQIIKMVEGFAKGNKDLFKKLKEEIN